MVQMNLFTKQKETYRLREQLMVMGEGSGGKGGGRDRLQVWG